MDIFAQRQHVWIARPTLKVIDQEQSLATVHHAIVHANVRARLLRNFANRLLPMRTLQWAEDDPEPPAPPSEDALALHRVMAENELLRDANKRLEAALRAAGRVLEPYIRAARCAPTRRVPNDGSGLATTPRETAGGAS